MCLEISPTSWDARVKERLGREPAGVLGGFRQPACGGGLFEPTDLEQRATLRNRRHSCFSLDSLAFLVNTTLMMYAFYEYSSMHMEPWDGPAGIVLTEGRYACCVTDRNGVRPARWVMTRDRHIILGSEIGVWDYLTEDVIAKGLDAMLIRPLGAVRVAIGAMFLVPASLFSAPGGLDSIRGAYEVLLEEPMEFAFKRELGDF